MKRLDCRFLLKLPELAACKTLENKSHCRFWCLTARRGDADIFRHLLQGLRTVVLQRALWN